MKKKIRTYLTYNSKDQKNEVNEEKSLTIPNQAYTIQELLRMHIQGIKPDIQKQAIYEDEDFGENFNPLRKQNFDLSDLDEIKDDLTKVQQYHLNKEKEAKKASKIAEKAKIIADHEAAKEKTIEKEEPL